MYTYTDEHKSTYRSNCRCNLSINRQARPGRTLTSTLTSTPFSTIVIPSLTTIFEPSRLTTILGFFQHYNIDQCLIHACCAGNRLNISFPERFREPGQRNGKNNGELKQDRFRARIRAPGTVIIRDGSSGHFRNRAGRWCSRGLRTGPRWYSTGSRCRGYRDGRGSRCRGRCRAGWFRVYFGREPAVRSHARAFGARVTCVRDCGVYPLRVAP